MNNLKKYLPHIFVVFLFFVIAYAFTPQVFEGKVVNQSDIASWRGMANEILTYNNSNVDGQKALWTNSMFSGMPATTISVVYEGDFTDYIYKLLFMGYRPPTYLFVAMFGAFLMFLSFGANVYVSCIGAIAVAFCSYNFQIIQVGHNSKMVAIALMPWVLAALNYAYKKKMLLGAVLFGLAVSFQIKANHPQITYYLAMMIVLYGLFLMYQFFLEKKLTDFFKRSALILVVGLLGIATNVNHLWPTYEYSKYTMRGGSELKEEGGKSSGLDLQYATQWSYSPKEIPNLFIPNYNGGASSGELSKNSETYKFLKNNNYQGAEEVVKQLPLYWGPQPFTAGPMYMGAVSIFLFILGLFIFKGSVKWWLAGISLLAILLSWGSHLMSVTEFFFRFAPLYNKFRTVSMILVILQVAIPLLAFLTLDKLAKEEIARSKAKKDLLIALAITAGFSLIMWIMPSLAGEFRSPSDSRLPEQLLGALILDRKSLLSIDALRSLILVVLSAGLIWFMLDNKIKRTYVYAGFALLVIFDLWGVGKRYLNDDHFVNNQDFTAQYNKRPVDEIILKDNDPNYRVLDLSINTFNDSHVSYHHKTIGGYSPAKLQRYQDLIDYYISPEMQKISKDIAGSKTLEEAQGKLSSYPILNMLNTKYIIIGPSYPPLVNGSALGNCWFADSIVISEGAKDEISKLGNINTKTTVVVDKQYNDLISSIKLGLDTSAVKADSVWQTKYSPNVMEYSAITKNQRLVVFSEIYYPAGWKAFVDGKETEILRVNYLLRAIKLDSGEHKIEFKYSPDSIVKGEHYSMISSILILLLLIGAVIFEYRSAAKKG